MSDTPETDCESGFFDMETAVSAAFARKLERERNEAMEQRNCLHDLHNKNAIHSQELLELCGTLRKERDEADRSLEKERIALNYIIKRAIETERERNEAREQLRKASVEANTLATSIQKAEYPDAKEFELLGSVAGVISQIDNMYSGVRQQRDEARDMVEKLTEQGLDLMDENRMLKRQIKEIKNTIRETLEANRHLADGDDCTLKKLKQAVPDWE